VPAELGLARDPRELGVALLRIVVRQVARERLVSAAAGHGLTSTGLPFRRRSADRTARGYL
jgi:hypothetical protein